MEIIWYIEFFLGFVYGWCDLILASIFSKSKLLLYTWMFGEQHAHTLGPLRYFNKAKDLWFRQDWQEGPGDCIPTSLPKNSMWVCVPRDQSSYCQGMRKGCPITETQRICHSGSITRWARIPRVFGPTNHFLRSLGVPDTSQEVYGCLEDFGYSVSFKFQIHCDTVDELGFTPKNWLAAGVFYAVLVGTCHTAGCQFFEKLQTYLASG